METMPEFDTFQIKPTHLEEPEDNGIVSSDSAGNRGEVTSGALPRITPELPRGTSRNALSDDRNNHEDAKRVSPAASLNSSIRQLLNENVAQNLAQNDVD